MGVLTKDQQEFWDILKLPYHQNCSNCIHAPRGWGSGCLHLNRHGNSYDCFNQGYIDGQEFRDWKWNGRNGSSNKNYPDGDDD